MRVAAVGSGDPQVGELAVYCAANAIDSPSGDQAAPSISWTGSVIRGRVSPPAMSTTLERLAELVLADECDASAVQ